MVVTAAGDETLRFWNIFPTAKNKLDGIGVSSLNPMNMDLR